MPRIVTNPDEEFATIGGCFTDSGWQKFRDNQDSLRNASKPIRYRDITQRVMQSDCIPFDVTSGRERITKRKRVGRMPAIVKSGVTVAEKKKSGAGRKKTWNPAEYVMAVGDWADLTAEFEKACGITAEQFSKDEHVSNPSVASKVGKFAANYRGRLRTANGGKETGCRFVGLTYSTNDESGAVTVGFSRIENAEVIEDDSTPIASAETPNENDETIDESDERNELLAACENDTERQELLDLFAAEDAEKDTEAENADATS